MRIVKIAFNTTETWNRDDFQKFITSVNEDGKLDKKFYILTTPDQAKQADVIKTQLNLDSTQVFTNVITYTDIVNKISELDINFYFCGDDVIVQQLNKDIIRNNVDLFKAFYVNWFVNPSTLLMKYIDRFRFELKILLDAQV